MEHSSLRTYARAMLHIHSLQQYPPWGPCSQTHVSGKGQNKGH